MYKRRSPLINRINYDLEAISHQLEDKEIEDIRLQIEEAISKMSNDTRKVVGVVSTAMGEISKSLSKRFGFNISLTHMDEGFFNTFVIPTKAHDVTLDTNEWLLTIYEELDQKANDNPDSFKKSGSDIDSILSKSYEALKHTLNTKSVVVDLEKAKINGLPDDFIVIIGVDLISSVVDVKHTSHEILACILHEVGHTFSHIEQLYRLTEGSTNLIDSIRDEFVRNGNLRDALELAYRKNTGKTADSMGTTELILETARSTIKMGHQYGVKDAESLSDVFAARFGYGLHVATALKKIYGKYGMEAKSFMSNMYAIFLTVVGIILLVLSIVVYVFAITNPNPLIFLGLAYTSIAMMLLGMVILELDDAVINFGGDSRTRYDNDSYDGKFDRLNKIRQQIISSLKNTELSNSTIKSIISQVDYIDKMLKKMKPGKSTMDRVSRLFSSRNDRIDTKYLLEDLINNDLNLSKARLKTI